MFEEDMMMFQKGFNRMSVVHNMARDIHYTVTFLILHVLCTLYKF
jgi:hypothetical protein